MEREKHSFWTMRLDKREGISSLIFSFLFFFRQDVEPGLKGDKKKQNSLQRARVQRDAYFNKSCGFSVSYYKLKS